MAELLDLLEPSESRRLRQLRLRPAVPDPARRVGDLITLDRESSWHELERVHRCEVARLLRLAAELSAGELADAAWPELDRERDVDGWKSEAALECLLALADGVESAAIDELATLVLSEPETWPGSKDLLEGSLITEDCEAGRLALARLHLAHETPRRALAVLSAALRRGVSDQNRWRLYTGLGRAHELCGGERLALEAFDLASHATELHPTPYVDGFFLALAVGDSGLAEGLARRLEEREFPSEALRTVRAALRARLRRRAVRLPWSPSDRATHRLFRQLCRRESGAAARLCRELSTGLPEVN